MADENFVIKLNLSRPNLSDHYLNANTADVIFKCSYGVDVEDAVEVSVPAHKIVLASESSVFQTMFYGHVPEQNVIEMTDVTADALKQFLHLFYKNEIICSINHVHEVLYLAEKYDVPECFFVCSEFLIERGRDSFKTVNFLFCSQTVLRTILQSPYLKGEGEVLLKACIDWAENVCRSNGLDCENMENRRNVLGNVLDLIEFASIKQSAAIDYLKKYRSLFDANKHGYVLDLISQKLTASTVDRDDWPQSPQFTRTTNRSLELKKGLPHRMLFEAGRNFLLYGIGFNIPDGVSFREDKFNLLVSIEKVSSGDHDQNKIFVGRLSIRDKCIADNGVFLSASLPDFILIDSGTNYVMELTNS